MNRCRPSSVTAKNGREPFASTSAGTTELTGRPADRSAAAIPSGPIRRSGTPSVTSTPAPTVTPAASARISSIGSTVPATSRAAATAHSVTQAARRHGRLSHGEAATVTATALASRAGPGNAALASHASCPVLAATAGGCPPPIRCKIPASAPPATIAPAARLASRRNRRWRSAAATIPAAATTNATCTSPASSRPAGSYASQVTADASVPTSWLGATATTASETIRIRPAPIRRMTSPGWR